MFSFQCFAVYLKQDETLSTLYMDGEGAQCFSATTMPVGEGLSGWVAHGGQVILNGNPRVEPNYAAAAGATIQLNSAISVPLFDLRGEIFGALTLYSTGANAFGKDHLRMLQAVESKFSLSLQNALRSDKRGNEAEVHLDTQLPNVRTFFLETDAELSMARRSADAVAVVVCKLNLAGLADESLLNSISRDLRQCCEPNDTIAAISKDEFVVLFRGAGEHNCSSKMEAIAEMVRKTCSDHQVEIQVPASMAAAYYPADGKTAEELLSVAQRRMFLQRRTHAEAVLKEQKKFPAPMAAVA